MKSPLMIAALLGASLSHCYPSSITLPAQGAWESGSYRNLFVEMGRTQAEVDAKVEAAFKQLFEGDSSEQRLLFSAGADMAFIKAIDSDDIRSEGQSYGMMIAVQMDRQDIFDKLWKFAKTYMQHLDGNGQGYFSWQLSTSEPYSMKDPNPAPDGEEYFAMALFFASNRWGDGTGIYAYSTEANAILHAMVHKDNSKYVPIMNPEHKMVEFSPVVGGERFTDPSYHLPSFYTLWSKWASEDQEYWAEVADTSRAYFHRACHPVTGLATEYQAFDGTPQVTSFNSNSATFNGDSWRVAMNVAMDYAWFAKDPWQVEQSVRLLTFFRNKGNYKSAYTQNGDSALVTYQSEGHVAMNAVAALASNDTTAWKFVDAFWKKPMATGTYRYYNGLLQMMGLLHCSGKYQIWRRPGESAAMQPRQDMRYTAGSAQGKNWDLLGRDQKGKAK